MTNEKKEQIFQIETPIGLMPMTPEQSAENDKVIATSRQANDIQGLEKAYQKKVMNCEIRILMAAEVLGFQVDRVIQSEAD